MLSELIKEELYRSQVEYEEFSYELSEEDHLEEDLTRPRQYNFQLAVKMVNFNRGRVGQTAMDGMGKEIPGSLVLTPGSLAFKTSSGTVQIVTLDLKEKSSHVTNISPKILSQINALAHSTQSVQKQQTTQRVR